MLPMQSFAFIYNSFCASQKAALASSQSGEDIVADTHSLARNFTKRRVKGQRPLIGEYDQLRNSYMACAEFTVTELMFLT